MKIEDILSRASDTKALSIGDGVIVEAPGMFKRLFAGKRPVIIADATTWRIAGENLQNLFESDGSCFGSRQHQKSVIVLLA